MSTGHTARVCRVASNASVIAAVRGLNAEAARCSEQSSRAQVATYPLGLGRLAELSGM